MKYLLLIICLCFPATVLAAGCPVSEGLFVQTASNKMSICEDSQMVRTYDVAIGRHGTGKRYRGDAKTPLGVYGLGHPHSSQNFGIFIPINYPTLGQKRLGYTGSDVGVHGPSRFLSWGGTSHNWFNWTDGCIAVANYYEINAVATWVRHHPRASIFIQ